MMMTVEEIRWLCHAINIYIDGSTIRQNIGVVATNERNKIRGKLSGEKESKAHALKRQV